MTITQSLLKLKKTQYNLLEDEVLSGGFSATKGAIDIIRDLGKDDHGIQLALADIDALLKKVGPFVLNSMAKNIVFKTQIKNFNYSRGVLDGAEIPDTENHVLLLMRYVEDDMNRKILSSKKSDTRSNRIKEKKFVMDFYRKNRNRIKLAFDLYNLVSRTRKRIDAK